MIELGMKVELCETEPEGRTPAKVSAALDGGSWDVVVYLGGDGTFHDVACGILGSKKRPPLGMLPAGTANDQGLSFGIRRGELARNLAVIREGHITELDVGEVEQLDHGGGALKSSLFFDSCGWGFHPDVLVARNRQKRRVARVPLLREVYRDKVIYVAASVGKLLESYVEPIKFTCEVVADGTRHELTGLLDLVVSGTPIFAGHWVLDRRAEPDDGRFELVPFRGRRDWSSKVLRDLAASPIWQEQLDHLGLSHSESLSASSYLLDFYRPERGELLAQVDGEEWGSGDRYRVTVKPRLLPIITPRDFVPPWRPRDAQAP
jgi:diacylglycerol kinase family enzyme